MTPDRWQQIKDLLHAATEHDPAERAAWLATQCADDAALLQEVEALLGFESQNEGFLESPPAAVAAKALENSTAELLSGHKLGRYELQGVLGRGGMGTVYRAQDTQLDRQVALKLLPRRFTLDEERVRRFRQEARAISALNHPNILTIHEIGETVSANGATHFIATEFVEGRTLRAALREGNLTLGAVLDVTIQTAAALAAAHRAGIVHRDIKPENLMLRPDGLVKVLDFGLAKLSVNKTVTNFSTVNTNPGLIMGTVSYMSPEQARGLEVDARSDLFSLGVVLYEMLTARPPFAGATTGDVLVSILEREPPPLKRYAAQLPAALQMIVSRAIAKERDQRYQHASELLDALKELKQELELSARLKRSGDTPAGQVSLSLRVGQSAPNDAAVNTGVNTDDAPTVVTTPVTKPAFFRRFAQPLKLPALTFMVLSVALVGWALYRFGPKQNSEEIHAIAVLPFVNTDADPQIEYLSDGLTESLMHSLQQLPELRVMARGTVYSYKGRDVDPRQLGQALQVQAVINGRVQKQGEQLLIRVELADARDGTRLWGENYQRPMKDLTLIQTELTRAVSDQLAQRTGAPKTQQLAQPQTRNAEAYRLYLLGRYHAYKQTREDSVKARDYYQQALALDPAYALAYAGLANHYAFASSRYLAPQAAMPQAQQAALKALELNPNLAEAHFALALVKSWGDWDWPAAEQEFKRALDLNPNLADAHTIYANQLSLQRRFPEFHREIKLAQQLDPLSAIALEMSAWGLYFEGRYDEALAECRKLQSLDPSYQRAYLHLGYIYRQKGQLREAIAEVEKGLAQQRQETLLAALAYLYAVAGQPAKARKLLAELEEISRQQQWSSPYLFAKIYVGLGEHERALACLEQTHAVHSEFLMSMGVDPIFAPLHAAPRFIKLRRDIGLQP